MSKYTKVQKYCKKHGLKVRRNYVLQTKWKIKCPHKMIPKYITVHNTDNDASAANEIAYMRRNSNQTSFHFAVDENEAVAGVRMDRNAWHAGDGNGNGNMKSIGVEICRSTGDLATFKKCEKNAAILIKAISETCRIPSSKIVQHNHWSGKDCPKRTRKLGWDRFIDMVKKVGK